MRCEYDGHLTTTFQESNKAYRPLAGSCYYIIYTVTHFFHLYDAPRNGMDLMRDYIHETKEKLSL